MLGNCFPASSQFCASEAGLVALVTRLGDGRAVARWSSGMGVTQDLWEQEDINLLSWHGFGVEIWKPDFLWGWWL